MTIASTDDKPFDAGQFRSKGREPIELPVREAIFDDDIRSIDISEFA